ncbi:MAG: hypothetical protein IPH97_04545 [Ignavibacteriales bacterium]|nr:hypothetical protein [Ignavibacteriales bacterium]
MGKNFKSLSNGALNFVKDKISANIQNFENELKINGEQKYLSFTISSLEDPDTSQTKYSVVIKDLTDTKRLEEEAKRNEKLSAMGELASGVAHEIRNPINAIGMIAQRLNKEFNPNENENEYLDITQILRNEVNRINKIITQFLSYAKPIDVNLRPVDIKSYLSEVYKLFEVQAKQKLIVFILQGTESITINLDADLIKQSLMNILQNAFDATKIMARLFLSILD